MRGVAAFAIGQLARQDGHATAFALLNFLARFLARLRRAYDQLGEFFALLDVLVQPQVERRFNKVGDQAHRVAAVQALFDLALKLRIEHFDREHKAGARKDIFGHELDALGQQRVQFDEVFDGVEQAFAQAALVRAARGGGDQINKALAHGLTVFGKHNCPLSAFAFGKAFVVLIGKAAALKGQDDGVLADGLQQIVAQAAFVEPLLRVFVFLVRQADRHARHEHR